MDLTLTDIADEAGIHYTTLMKALPLLEELNMVTMTRQVGNAKLYQINKDDIVVKRLIKFLNKLNIRLAEQEASRQGIAVHEKEMVLALKRNNGVEHGLHGLHGWARIKK
ncbi:MAG TPA: hypothetical protein VIO58_09285 [Candidatus Methanoperedens sp.]